MGFEETILGMIKNHYGLSGKVGGWIYRADGKPICQGWVALHEMLKPHLLPHHPFVNWSEVDRILKSPRKRDFSDLLTGYRQVRF